MRNPRWSRQPEADDRAGTGVEAHGTGSEAPEVPAARSAQRVHVVAGAIPVAAAGIIKAPQARERQDRRTVGARSACRSSCPGPLPMVPTAVPGWRPGAGRPTLPIAANSRPGLPRELMNRLVTEAVPDLGSENAVALPRYR